MSDFKPTERTVVSELRNFVVDKRGRNLVQRGSQSAYLGADNLTSQDFVVTENEGYTFRVNHHVTLNSPSPVLVSMSSTASPQLPDTPEVPSYQDATIVVNDFIIGNDFTITLIDDTPLLNVNVVVYNLTTGETESIELNRVNDVFVGTVSTALGTWNSFDNVLHPENNNVIRVMYTDNRSASGKPKTIIGEAKAISPYSDAKVQVPAMIRRNLPVGIMVEDRDLDHSVGNINIEYAVGTSFGTMTLLRTERPYGTVFVGTLDTSSFDMPAGEQFIVRYIDPRDANGFPKVIERISTVVEPTQTTGELIVPDLNGYGDFYIRLVDLDISGQTLQIIVTNEDTGQYIAVNCEETVFGSGSFIGKLTLTADTPVTLNVTEGDVISVKYVDQNTQTNESSLIQVNRTFILSEDVTDPPTEPTVFVPGTVEFVVNGMFSLTGSFNGNFTVKGIGINPTRCNILFA